MLAERVVEWTQQWKAEGLQQGLQQGQMQEARAMLLEVLAARFETLLPDLVDAVQRIEDREVLHRLIRQAATCTTLAVFRELLQTQG